MFKNQNAKTLIPDSLQLIASLSLGSSSLIKDYARPPRSFVARHCRSHQSLASCFNFWDPLSIVSSNVVDRVDLWHPTSIFKTLCRSHQTTLLIVPIFTSVDRIEQHCRLHWSLHPASISGILCRSRRSLDPSMRTCFIIRGCHPLSTSSVWCPSIAAVHPLSTSDLFCHYLRLLQLISAFGHCQPPLAFAERIR